MLEVTPDGLPDGEFRPPPAPVLSLLHTANSIVKLVTVDCLLSQPEQGPPGSGND